MKQSTFSSQIFFSLLIACLCACPLMRAQESADFFDPTRKEKQIESYTFRVDYRIEGGYSQSHQRMTNDTVSALYLHGARIGATFDFILPKHFSVQTGLLYTIRYGKTTQHFHSSDPIMPQAETLTNNNIEHLIAIPVRVYYSIPLWKQLSMYFYTGPQLTIGLAYSDYITSNLSDATRTWLEANGRHTTSYDRYQAGELFRTNIQYGLGGGFEWDCYRIEAGYDFGLNNILRLAPNPNDRMAEWEWHVSFVYRLNIN